MADKAAFQVIVLVSLIGFLQIPPADPCVGVDTQPDHWTSSPTWLLGLWQMDPLTPTSTSSAEC
jgi:hypothetical protein